MISASIKEIEQTWPKISKAIYVPHTKSEYEKLRKQLDDLIDLVGNNEKHPLASLLETIGVIISNFESFNFPMKSANGIDVLKYLMEEHNLKQTDLKEIGSQGVVSEILNGKRDLNLRQIRALAKRFSVAPGIFV